MNKKIVPVLSLLAIFLVMASCSPNAGNATSKEPKDYSQYQNLAACLRTVPGVIVSGNNISLRGGGGGGIAAVSPLFVVDNVIVGTNYERVNGMVVPVNISEIKVLNGTASTNRYGQEGRGGVILIKTKTAEGK